MPRRRVFLLAALFSAALAQPLPGAALSVSSGPAIAEGSTGAAGATADVVLDAGAGLTWRIVGVPGGAAAPQYALGQPMLRGEPLDNLVVDNGIAFWRRMSDATAER